MNRLKKIKSIRDKLKNGDCSIGSWIQIPHTSISEIMGNSGYDWIAVDMEHGAISVHQLPDLFRAIELGDSLPLARLAYASVKDCKQALDAGAGGVIVPMIENEMQLKQVCDFCRWPPVGTRGVGFSRANLFGENFDDYKEEAQQPFIVAMIEHVSAVKSLDKILSVRGLDAIFIGPYDLSASMGITGQFNDIKFTDTIAKICELSKKNKIPCGIHIVNPSIEELRTRVVEGYKLLAYSIDSVILSKELKKASNFMKNSL